MGDDQNLIKPRILAIESSCDDTSVCLLHDGKVHALVTASQIDHDQFGGVFPELASRLHAEKITLIIEKALRDANWKLSDVDAFAATAGPGLIGSLHIGVMAAKTLAFRYQKPYIPVHHLAAHIEAGRFVQPFQYPLLSLLVSGGHTMLIEMEKPFHYRLIGQTRDDAAGEAFDKVARMMGLPYPGGPHIDTLASQGKPHYTLPLPLDDDSFDFSFSGLKTSVQQRLQANERDKQPLDQADLAYAVQTTIIEALLRKTKRAIAQKPYKMLVLAGGVASNKGLRHTFQEWSKEANFPLVIPPSWACTDNGAMIALVAEALYSHGGAQPLSHKVDPNWSLTDVHFEV